MKSNYFEFVNSVKILSGKNAINNIPYECDFLGVKNPLLLSDDGLKKIGSVDNFIAILKNDMKIKNIYTDIPTDSSTKTINDIIKFYSNNKCDGIIALGGGSVIDTAKGVRMALSQGEKDIMKLMGNEIIKRGKKIPFIVVPTTCGTGSECTSVAVIKNHETHLKMEFISSELLPDVAVVDVRMTMTLPAKLTASTSLDALTHAIEAYTSLQKNPISDVYALSSIKLIVENLPVVLQDPNNGNARLNVALASTLAGIAFSNAMVGVVHAIGHACGSVCNVPHGNAMACLLVPCMEFNCDKVGSLYGDLLMYFGGADIYSKTPVEFRGNVAIEKVKQFLYNVSQLSGLNLKLSDYGVVAERLESIADTALNDGAIIVNSKDVSRENILEILKRAL